jgi:hypothetical protein
MICLPNGPNLANLWTFYGVFEIRHSPVGSHSKLYVEAFSLNLSIYRPVTECSLCSLIRRPECVIGRHCGISRQAEGHIFGDHLISESVSVTPSSAVEAFLCSVLCLYDSWESMSNQPALWTPDIMVASEVPLACNLGPVHPHKLTTVHLGGGSGGHFVDLCKIEVGCGQLG